MAEANKAAIQVKAHPRVAAYVRWLRAHGRMLWAIALLLAVPAAVRTVSLYIHLKSDIEELLPRRAESVAALDELRARMPGLRYLGVIVDTGSAENLPHAEKFIDDLAARIEHYPSGLVKRVKTGIREEREFFERNAPLYLDTDDIRTARLRIEAARDQAVSQALDLGIEDEPQPKNVDLSDLEAKYRRRQSEAQRFPNDRFSSPDKKLTLLLIEVAELTTGADLGNELFRHVEADIRDLGGLSHYAPGMRLGYTGDIAIDHEELAALVSDLTTSSLAVMALVLLAVLLFYRWAASILALLFPLSLGALYAFALVTLGPIGIKNLNSNTAFLASVIVGNGVNFGVMMLARYVEERRRGASIDDALTLSIVGSRTGTLVAALAAAAAYGSLAFTQFRGFKQFGVIGGLGMLMCWLCAFVLAPPLIAWLDRHGGSLRASASTRGSLMTLVSGLVTRFPGRIAAAALLLTVLSLGRVRTLGRNSIEYDFSRLRRADSHVSGEAYWGAKMDDLLGRYLTPLVMLTDDRGQASALKHALRDASERPPLHGAIDTVTSIEDVLPADQERKLEELRALRAVLTPRLRAELKPEQRAMLDRYLGQGDLKPLAPSDLPTALTTGLRERDGSFDKTVLIYPHPSQATWQGPAITEMTDALRSVAQNSRGQGRVPRLAGSIPLSADIISSIERDGPLATGIALGAVIALVAVIFRFSIATPLILGSLLIAVLWVTAGIMTLGIKINFCNFIAFPITFGIGVDYAVNVMTRYRESDPPNVLDAIRSTGGAVGLCSLTTIIGYGSLLFAQNQALFLFGVVAVLGEVVCLLTAVVLLPAVLVLVRRASSPMIDALPPALKR
jgi:predicted RND superfamily exporter protein